MTVKCPEAERAFGLGACRAHSPARWACTNPDPVFSMSTGVSEVITALQAAQAVGATKAQRASASALFEQVRGAGQAQMLANGMACKQDSP